MFYLFCPGWLPSIYIRRLSKHRLLPRGLFKHWLLLWRLSKRRLLPWRLLKCRLLLRRLSKSKLYQGFRLLRVLRPHVWGWFLFSTAKTREQKYFRDHFDSLCWILYKSNIPFLVDEYVEIYVINYKGRFNIHVGNSYTLTEPSSQWMA